MKLGQITRIAKDAIDKRGGVDALKHDLQEAKHAARGHDSLMDKARAAAGAFKQPGRDRAEPAAGREAPRPPASGQAPLGAYVGA
jgi:hypothetical protein